MREARAQRSLAVAAPAIDLIANTEHIARIAAEGARTGVHARQRSGGFGCGTVRIARRIRSPPALPLSSGSHRLDARATDVAVGANRAARTRIGVDGFLRRARARVTGVRRSGIALGAVDRGVRLGASTSRGAVG